MNFYEEITRRYVNGFVIKYEVLNSDNIYIHSVYSRNCKRGKGTESMRMFLEEFSNKNIYLFSTDEMGTEKSILDKWYERLGFKLSKEDSLPYNVTHCKLK